MNYKKNKTILEYKPKYFILHLILIKFLHQIAPNFLNAYYEFLYLPSHRQVRNWVLYFELYGLEDLDTAMS